MNKENIILEAIAPDDILTFKKELQDSFSLAIIDELGIRSDEPIPSDDDLDRSINAPDSVVLRIIKDHEKVGGAILSIDKKNHQNSLDFFFIKTGAHGQGLGRAAWFAIEKLYPETKSWHTHTPYFEKRNIHFYVNKCGFKIVAFFNEYHPDPHAPASEDFPGHDEAFRFEKIMY